MACQWSWNISPSTSPPLPPTTALPCLGPSSMPHGKEEWVREWVEFNVPLRPTLRSCSRRRFTVSGIPWTVTHPSTNRGGHGLASVNEHWCYRRSPQRTFHHGKEDSWNDPIIWQRKHFPSATVPLLLKICIHYLMVQDWSVKHYNIAVSLLELWTGLNFSAWPGPFRPSARPGPLNKLEFWARPVRILDRPGRPRPVAPCSLKILFITSKIHEL